MLNIIVATDKHLKYIEEINTTIAEASKARGTGIARRTYEYIKEKILEGKAVIALEGRNFAGFCYIETWEEGHYVAHSGLIVAKQYRKMGLAKTIKQKVFELSRKKFPKAKVFGLTTSLAVMKINSELGYRPVTFSELTDEGKFWNGCKSCVNHDILERMDRSKCLCTGMLFDPKWDKKQIEIHKRHKRIFSKIHQTLYRKALDTFSLWKRRLKKKK